jgi:hypothetical protein
MVASDKYHRTLVLGFRLIFDRQYASLIPRRNYDKRDSLLLYDTLYNSDRSCILNENSVDSAAAVSEAINLAIPFVKSKN